MKTILAMGQSNAVGRAEGGGWNIPSSVTVWNNANDLEDLSSLGTAFVVADRAAAPFVNGKNCPFVHAAKYLAQLTGDSVRLLLVAKGGQSISKWDGKTSPMYARMAAVLAAAGVTKLDVFLWHQGENDAIAPTGYVSKWQGLLANMVADSLITMTTPIVIGEVSPENNAINPVLHSLVDIRTDIAPLKTIETFDKVHFNASGVIEAGYLYAKRAFAMLPETPPAVIENPSGPFVSTYGLGGINLLNGVDTKVPVSPNLGSSDMISADGAFIAPFAATYRFMLQGYAGKGPTRLKILDDTALELRFVAYSGAQDPVNNNPILSGWCDLDLPAGAKIWLGIQQNCGSTTVLDQASASLYCKMSVNVLRRPLT